MTSDEVIIEQIVKRHGEVINVRKSPDVIIDIIRTFRSVLDENGGLPGGVPPSPPPPPPGPSSMGGEPTVSDVMKEVLKLSRAVEDIARKLGPSAST
jgi:hypothetical protein